MIQQKVFEMMNASKERIIKTMQERGITKINLVMTQEEWAKENDFDPDDDLEIYEDDYNDYRNQEAPYVIFFNKWGNGMDYSAYSVELVDGPVIPRFKLGCYNSEEGSEWFYDSDLTNLSMIGVYDAMEKELEMEDEPKKMESWLVGKYGEDDDCYLDRLDGYEKMMAEKYDLQKHEVTVVFGENAAQAYMNGGVKEMRNHIDEGQLVRKEFDTEAERKAYIAGIDDADGWLGAAVIDEEDLKKHPRIINQLLNK